MVGGLADGAVDVVVGTHRLLADDVNFADLGLLVVDEEQRFGVSHKEAMKKLAVGVDVLTLTASPIPRTLEMGLTGIRDLSIIDTPPAARQPILTYVGEEDERADRGGDPPGAPARGSGLLRPQPGARHRDGPPAAPRARPRGTHRDRPRPDGRGNPRTGRPRLLPRGATTSSSARRSSSPGSTCRRSTPSSSTAPICSASGSSTSCAAGSGGPGSGPTPTSSIPRDRVLSRAGLRAAAHDRRAHRARLGLQDRDARPRDPWRGQPARLRTSPATSQRSATTSTSGWSPRRSPS